MLRKGGLKPHWSDRPVTKTALKKVKKGKYGDPEGLCSHTK